MSIAISSIDYLNAADKFWLGEQLQASRHLRGFDIPQTARLLNLSQAQVLAIEAGSQGPFLHISHYIHHVQRYAESMNTPQSTEVLGWLERLEDRLQRNESSSSQLVRVEKLLRARLANDVSMPTGQERFNRVSSMRVSIALIVLGFVMTLPLMWAVDYTENSVTDHKIALQQAAVLVSLNTEISMKAMPSVVYQNIEVNNENTDVVTIENKASKILGMQFTAPCWVQVTAQDGRVTDRLYEVGEVLQLDLQTTASLVIGNVTGTTAVTESGNRINLHAFVAGGNVARLKGPDLVSLAYGLEN